MELERADKVLQKLWDKDVRAWHEHWVPIFRRFAHDLVSDAAIYTGQIVLDVGTGTGIAAMEAASRVRPGGLVLGIDRSARMLELAETNPSKKKPRNLCFFRMNADHMLFPDELFDAVISNCGMSYATFPGTVSEVFRVLCRGGSFTFDDWHLIDVPAHRTFSAILQQHRTEHPSEKLRVQRAALATLEHVGNRYLDVKAQARELEGAGFKGVEVKRRNYEITLPGIREYLRLRLERAALKQELLELPSAKRARLLTQLKNGLKPFMRGSRFIFEWKVNFFRAKKPL